MQMKRCTRCGTEKPVAEFHRETASKDGLFRWCKACKYEQQKEWNAANPDRVKAAARRFAEKHPERQKAWHKAWRDKNPEKMREYARRSRARNPDYARQARAAALKRQYGITIVEYEAMLKKQRGVCLLCKQPPSPSQVLCVDHCHNSRQVRGLLCSLCNRTLGMQSDDPAWFARAARYLRNAQSNKQ